MNYKKMKNIECPLCGGVPQFATKQIDDCEDCSDLSQIAEVREKAIAIAKELSVGYYMENGDEDMR